MRQYKPAYVDDKIALFRGDALRIIPQLEFNHVICDPPYEERIHRAKMGRRKLRTDGGAPLRSLDFASIDDIRPKLIPLVKERCPGWFLAFCTPEGIAPWRDAIEAGGMRYKRACFWIKPDAAPQFNGQGPAFAVEPFVAAWCSKGVSKWQGGGRKNWWSFPTNNPDREGTHATEKPVDLMMALIEAFTNPGDVVLDPFMGSGTTIIAAVALGRRAIGIEKDPHSFKLARARIDSAFRMGRDEGRRYIARALKRGGSAADLPLFGGEVASE